MAQEFCKKVEIPDPIKESLNKIGGLPGIEARLPSNERIKKLSKIFHAMSDPLRVQILFILDNQPLCVCLIKELTAAQDSKLSYHLSVLKDAGLISGKQEANWIIYEISDLGKLILASVSSIH
ncbi:MAG: metalloregulator ArsR/SmtB family transcription factor [Methanomassiliicoccales archaeon]